MLTYIISSTLPTLKVIPTVDPPPEHPPGQQHFDVRVNDYNVEK